MGDKIESKKLAEEAGVTTIPGFLGVLKVQPLPPLNAPSHPAHTGSPTTPRPAPLSTP